MASSRHTVSKAAARSTYRRGKLTLMASHCVMEFGHIAGGGGALTLDSTTLGVSNRMGQTQTKGGKNAISYDPQP